MGALYKYNADLFVRDDNAYELIGEFPVPPGTVFGEGEFVLKYALKHLEVDRLLEIADGTQHHFCEVSAAGKGRLFKASVKHGSLADTGLSHKGRPILNCHLNLRVLPLESTPEKKVRLFIERTVGLP
jgi:hypothetical protein